MLDLFLVQIDSVLSDDPNCKAKNFEKARNLLRKAGVFANSKEREQLILLPEMFATGYLPHNPEKFAEDFKSTGEESLKKNETSEFLQQLAKDTCSIVFGAGIHQEAGKIFNHVGVFTPISDSERLASGSEGHSISGSNLLKTSGQNYCGEIAGYNKIHSFFPEIKRGFSAGNSINLFRINSWKIASFICYDLRFPELFREAVRRGSNLITIQAAWPLVRKDHWEILLRARAIENQVYIAAVNGVSPQEGNSAKKLGGISMIVDPRGNVIAAGSDNTEEIVCGTIDLPSLEQYRKEFPVLEGILDAEDIS